MKKVILCINIFFTLFFSCTRDDTQQRLPDLTCSTIFTSIRISAGGTIQEVVEIKNIGTRPTTGTIVFTITNFLPTTGLVVTSNTDPSVTINGTTYLLNNSAEWDITSSGNVITISSKPGVSIDRGATKYIGINISRASAPNEGPDGTVNQSVTISDGTGGGETPFTNNSCSTTLIKEAGTWGIPDLTPVQIFSSLQITAGGTIQEVVQIKNIGSGPTTGLIVFSLTNYSPTTGLSVSSNNNTSVTIGSSTYSLNNAADWDIQNNPGALTIVSKPGVVIPAGGSKFVGFTISRPASPNQGSNGSASHTITISGGTGGGETPSSNNSSFEIIVKS